MTKDEIVEQFGLLSFAEKCEVMQGFQDEFVPHWPAEHIAEFESWIKRVRSNPERASIWDRVRQEVRERRANLPPCPAK
jgi:hypothetical protein